MRRVRGRDRLLFRQTVHPILGEVMQKYNKRGVSPAKADDILLISRLDTRFRGASHHVVFLPDGAVTAKILRDRTEEFVRNPIGVMVKPVPSQTLNGDN